MWPVRAGLCGAACPWRTWAVETIYGGAESGPGDRGAAALDGRGQVVRPRQVRRALPSCEDPDSHVSRVFFSCWRRCIDERVILEVEYWILDIVDVDWCPEGGRRAIEFGRPRAFSTGPAGRPTLSSGCHVTLWCCLPSSQASSQVHTLREMRVATRVSGRWALGAGRWPPREPC